MLMFATCKPYVSCFHVQSVASSKQANKTKLDALHEHTAWCNSAGFEARLCRVVEEGLGPQGMACLTTEPDLDVVGLATRMGSCKYLI